VSVFLDTNVLFSAFGHRGVCLEILRECRLRHSVLISDFVLEELRRTLSLKLHLERSEIEDIVEQLRENSEIVVGYEILDIPIGDKNDIPILSAAIASKADILVTGDKEILQTVAPVEILSPKDLLRRLSKR
jgi:putative PIN family toxin of toxin-antitoxin system